MARVVVLGYIVRGPLGGLAWHHLQYVMGLAALGHDVIFVEDSGDYPACYDPVRQVTDTDPTYGLHFASAAFDKVGLGKRWAYYDAHNQTWCGPLGARSVSMCESSSILLNVSGVNPLRPWLRDIPHRVLIDTDPVFTQIRHLTETNARELADNHTAFLTYGENVGTTNCSVPDDGYPWQATRQPVFLPAWPVTSGHREGRYTTVMQWDSYVHRDYQGRHYGMKSESFAPYFRLPALSEAKLELALGSPNAPRDELRLAGWSLRNPLEVTVDPWRYQEYIQGSKGEFGVAKHGYVTTRSGWFSERTACYLASGRPAVVQDSGFSDWLRSEGGLLPFTNMDEAVAALKDANGDYETHCRLARSIAEKYFDSDRVLNDLLEKILYY